jgi:hypothetical protein
MRRRPAVASVPDICAHALVTSNRDRIADEALLDRVVHLREAHHRHIDPICGDRGVSLFRGCARNHVGTDNRTVLRGRLTGDGVCDSGDVTINGRSETEASALMTRRSSSQFATNFEKSWLKARWMTPSDRAAPSLRLSISSSDPRWTSAPAAARAPPLSRPNDRGRAPDGQLGDGRADESRSTSDKHAHEQSLPGFVANKSGVSAYSGE